MSIVYLVFLLGPVTTGRPSSAEPQTAKTAMKQHQRQLLFCSLTKLLFRDKVDLSSMGWFWKAISMYQ